jgi:hypothetical protein
MRHLQRLALVTTLAGALAAPAAQAQSVYGEVGYSALSATLTVPVLGISVKSEPAMARAMIGVSPFAGLGVEGMIGTGVRDDRLRGNQAIDSRVKVNEFLGVYLASRLNLGPVELFGRAGVAETRLRFEGLGSGDGSDFSYGGGIRLLPTDNLTLSLDYMNYFDKGGVKIDGYTLSVGLKF